jgi:hypothetical protein
MPDSSHGYIVEETLMNRIHSIPTLPGRANRVFPLLLAATLGCHCCATRQANSPATGPSAAAVEERETLGSAATAPTQATFASPEQAAATLKEAVRDRDRAQLLQIFGPEGEPLLFSGDRVQDDNRMSAFEQHMSEQLRVDHPTPNKAVLYIGAKNWPFPIPLVSDGSQWHFDTAAGKDEILDRRIGQNELSTIDAANAFVRAQQEYASRDRVGDKTLQYAQHFRSTPGKHDGLYWDSTSADDFSPMGDLVADAEAEGYTAPTGKPHHQPYHGYFFHILTAQGADAPGGQTDYLVNGKLIKGFALIAYPAEWGNSGEMTFEVNQTGKIYQKDLGPQTADAASKITEYDPDSTWQEAKE